ncbi:transposase family protein [Streptomyces sp. LN704]|uniref:transposase family protein n=1 Tax=Streptomyces sp. LN704 TaxID=3112982 RepID=UPI003715581D
MVTYVATLDVPRHVVDYLARLLAAHRRRIGTPRCSRALGPFRQAVLVLRWFRERGCVHCLVRNAGVSQATGYRYLHEGIGVLADRAPDLHEVLDRRRCEGMTHVILDGTLIESDRVAGVRENGNDLWFSQKTRHSVGTCSFCPPRTAPHCGSPMSRPGSTPDITAARIHALPALYKAAADGLPTLADKGYIGAGIGIHVPVRRPKGRSEQALHADTRTMNNLIRGVRALGERAAVELKQRWRTLQYVTLSPSRIGDIARAALVLNGIWK